MWEKIVLNLLSNAFKFTFDGEIAGRALRLRDGRRGTSGARYRRRHSRGELPRLFERFHRIEGQRSRSFEGSGIGLALVKELVKLHGGTIRIDSDLGKGTAFTISIPCGTVHLSSGANRWRALARLDIVACRGLRRGSAALAARETAVTPDGTPEDRAEDTPALLLPRAH